MQARLGVLADAEATRAVRSLCEVEDIRQSGPVLEALQPYALAGAHARAMV